MVSTGLYDLTKGFLKAVNAGSFSLPIAYENVDYQPEGNDPWLAVFQLPLQPVQASLGDDGCDFHEGILQIDINYPASTGRTLLDAKADEINAYFKSGATFTENDIKIRIENVGLARVVVDRGWITGNLNIEYYAYSERL